MKLLSLKLKNLRQHADTEVVFPASGVIGIVGSNGGGKSTILEGAAWALYGTAAIRGTVKTMRWNRAPARHIASAELRFEVGGQVYRIERTENNAELFLDGSTTPIAAGTDAVNNYVPGLVGMPYKEFAATYMCGQKDLDRIAAMGGTERRQFFLQVMGVGRIDEALAACRKRKNELARERDGLQAGLGEREPLAEEVETSTAEVTARESEAQEAGVLAIAASEAAAVALAALEASEKRRVEQDALQATIRQTESQIATADRELERLAGDLLIAEDAAKVAKHTETLVAPLPGLRAEREALLQARANASRKADLESVIASTEAQLERYRADVAMHEATIAEFDPEAFNAVVARFREIEAKLQEARSNRMADQQVARAAAEQARQEYKKTSRRIEAIEAAGQEGACPTCARALGEQFAAVVADLRKEATEYSRRIDEAEARIQDLADESDEEMELAAELEEIRAEGERLRVLKTSCDHASNQITSARSLVNQTEGQLAMLRANLASIPVTPFDAARLSAVEREIAELEVHERDLATARARAAQADGIRSRIAEWQAQRDTADSALSGARSALVELAFDPAVHEQLAAQADELRTRRDEAKGRHAVAEEALRGAQARLDRADQALKAYDARAEHLHALTRDLATHEAASERLADFRTAMAAGIRPEMEELASGFVQILTDGRHESVTLTDDFEMVLQENGVDVEVVSGGTQDIAAIAMRLAVSQMIAERAGHPLSLLILDEPFGSLDETRRGNVLALIRRLGGVFEQVLVISHVAETRDAVDAVIEVDYDEAAGRSTARCSGVGVPALEASEEPVLLAEVA